jgi:hypothetical protein
MKRDLEKNQTNANRRRYFKRAERNRRLRQERQIKKVEDFLFPPSANSDLAPSNDNSPQFPNDNFFNQSTEGEDNE